MKNTETGCINSSPKDNDFIMLPTVDVCFKKLMHNPSVRKGFISALLGVDPETDDPPSGLSGRQTGDPRCPDPDGRWSTD